MSTKKEVKAKAKTQQVIVKQDNQVNTKQKADRLKQNAAKREHGILYIGHLPYGFVEEGLKEYFTQFGDVLAVKLYRSKKTNRGQGYGFVKFQDVEVATIAFYCIQKPQIFTPLKAYQLYEKLHKSVVDGTIVIFLIAETYSRENLVLIFSKYQNQQFINFHNPRMQFLQLFKNAILDINKFSYRLLIGTQQLQNYYEKDSF